MKFFKLFLIFSLVIYMYCVETNLNLQSEKKFKSRKLKLKSNQQIDPKLKTQIESIVDGPATGPQDLPDAPIYYEGWVKYFHYRDTVSTDKPKSFFRNDAFHTQNRYIKDKSLFKKSDKV
jgi:hypothetical protein